MRKFHWGEGLISRQTRWFLEVLSKIAHIFCLIKLNINGIDYVILQRNKALQ